MDKRGYNYLKRNKPAPITKEQRQDHPRKQLRNTMRDQLKEFGWRAFVKLNKLKRVRKFSFVKKLIVVNRFLANRRA
jgi:hypothetical protein